MKVLVNLITPLIALNYIVTLLYCLMYYFYPPHVMSHLGKQKRTFGVVSAELWKVEEGLAGTDAAFPSC